MANTHWRSSPMLSNGRSLLMLPSSHVMCLAELLLFLGIVAQARRGDLFKPVVDAAGIDRDVFPFALLSQLDMVRRPFVGDSGIECLRKDRRTLPVDAGQAGSVSIFP